MNDAPPIDWLQTVTLRARWVFPVEGRPFENGTVEIANGRITSVDARSDRATVDLGNAALLPGFVNSHTHLELSDLSRPLQPGRPFTQWLQSVIRHRRNRGAGPQASAEAVRVGAVRIGIDESRRCGTTLLGDIVSPDCSDATLVSDGVRGVAFLESIGLSREQIAAQLEAARRHVLGNHSNQVSDPSAMRVRGSTLQPVGRPGPGHFVPGLSPHAPYSVHPELFERLVKLAKEARVPLAIHLAETCGELELLDQGQGEFVEFLQSLGVWQPEAIPRGLRPLDYLRQLATLDRALVIHGNYLVDDEIDLLGEHSGLSVVFCPRSHAYFGHDLHPWQTMAARGVNVSLGTDSRASNPDLSLWSEVLFLKTRYPQVAGVTLVEMATLNGAKALGQSTECGSLIAGKRAELAVVALPPVEGSDPYALLFDPSSRVLPALDCNSTSI
ncbi:MAG: amidohydrolase [Planctomycetaceae bacterium]|nr:amidohydrolase [Planctomycetaceae bacterium]